MVKRNFPKCGLGDCPSVDDLRACLPSAVHVIGNESSTSLSKVKLFCLCCISHHSCHL